jgi:hypothetical protein
MGLQVVNLAVHQPGRIEDPVAAVHHVIVEGDYHERRIGHDAAELARVEREVFDQLSRAKRPQPGEHIFAGQYGDSD